VTAILYEPEIYVTPSHMPDVPTAWEVVPPILCDILNRFHVKRNLCLELGTQHGYSTAALANFFNVVIGVDTFAGDEYAGVGDPDHTFNGTGETMKAFPNVVLVRSDFRQWIVNTRGRFDLCHIDLYHTYDITFAAAMWAVDNSDIVLAHDTISFPEVNRALEDVADAKGLKYFNWPVKHGLGILVRP
jgi:hypothetical protein